MDRQVAKLLRKARGHVEKGQLEHALTTYREATGHPAADADAWNERGHVAERLGFVDEASDCYFRLADMYARAGLPADAAFLIRRVLALTPGHTGARSFARMLHGYMEQPPPVPGGQPAQPAPVSVPPAAGDDVMLEAFDPHEDAPAATHTANVHVVSRQDYGFDEDQTERRSAAKPDDGEDVEWVALDVDAVQTDVSEVYRTESNMFEARSTPSIEVPAVEHTLPGGRNYALSEAVPDKRREVVPGSIDDEWRIGSEAGEREQRISHHSAKMAVLDVGLEAPEDPGDDNYPEFDIDPVLAIAETIPVSPLLSELDSDLVKYVVDQGTIGHRAPGQAVFRAGDVGESLYLILSGEVIVERRRLESEPIEQVAVLHHGAFFGETALLTDGVRTATIRAATDLTFLEISKDMVHYLADKQPRIRKLLTRFFRARMVGSLMARSELFQPFDTEERRQLVTRFRLRELPAGHDVLTKGEECDGLYLVLAGTMEVYEPSQGIALAQLGSADIFGEISLLQGTPVTTSVRAKTRSWVLRLPRDDFAEFIESNPVVFERLKKLAESRKAENAERLA